LGELDEDELSWLRITDHQRPQGNVQQRAPVRMGKHSVPRDLAGQVVAQTGFASYSDARFCIPSLLSDVSVGASVNKRLLASLLVPRYARVVAGQGRLREQAINCSLIRVLCLAS
jgi:hypothetical protein